MPICETYDSCEQKPEDETLRQHCCIAKHCFRSDQTSCFTDKCTSCRYYEFYSSVTCLLVEGVEFMSKIEIYEAIKRDWQKAQNRSLEKTRPITLAQTADYKALIAKYDKYIEFLSKDSLLAAMYGGCPQEDYRKGERLRNEIAALKNALSCPQ